MKCYQIVFSTTGGTERVARAITQNWSQVDTIDLSAPDTKYAEICFERDALVLIAMPSFGGAAPQLALNRLAMIKGNGAKSVIAAVYGHRAYEDTLVQMEDYAQNAGFQVIAAISAVAEHSIIHEYAAGRPNLNDCKELAEFGDRILEKATSNQLFKPPVPGNRPYKKAGTGMVPRADPAVPPVVCVHRNVLQALSLQTRPERLIRVNAYPVCDACPYVRLTPERSAVL